MFCLPLKTVATVFLADKTFWHLLVLLEGEYHSVDWFFFCLNTYILNLCFIISYKMFKKIIILLSYCWRVFDTDPSINSSCAVWRVLARLRMVTQLSSATPWRTVQKIWVKSHLKFTKLVILTNVFNQFSPSVLCYNIMLVISFSIMNRVWPILNMHHYCLTHLHSFTFFPRTSLTFKWMPANCFTIYAKRNLSTASTS